jgi:hypothetical protein
MPNEVLLAALSELDRLGVRDIERVERRHIELRWIYQGRTYRSIMPRSASDRRAVANQVAMLRRMMGIRPPPRGHTRTRRARNRTEQRVPLADVLDARPDPWAVLAGWGG